MSRRKVYTLGGIAFAIISCGFFVYQSFFIIHPLTKKWEKHIPFQEPPAGLNSIRAKDCGRCHQEIYQQWQLSTHAQAWFDPQFQIEWKKDDNIWLCLNCHTPMANQLEKIVIGTRSGDFERPVLEQNNEFDRELRNEGITCAACHVREGRILGSRNSKHAIHPVTILTRQRSLQLCVNCHQVSDRLTATLVCNFNTEAERQLSPAGKSDQICSDCHMRAQKGKRYIGSPDGFIKSHAFAGAGIAKTLSQQKAVKDKYDPGYDVTTSVLKKGKKHSVEIRIRNSRAGHEIPTGDVERFILINLQVTDAKKKLLWQKQEKIGEVWAWSPTARQVSDNSLKPLETRTIRSEFAVPTPALLEIKISNHRMTKENARFAGLLGKYPLMIETFSKTIKLK